MSKNEMDVHTGEIKQMGSKPLKEFGEGPGIEPITDERFVKAAQLEEFMNDVLTIQVAVGREASDNPIVVPGVNGVNQPIIRGAVSKVKRKYVEALARCTVTKYKQGEPDPRNPDQLLMNAFTSSETPFTVIYDPRGKMGMQWLQAIITSAAQG